MFCSKNSLLVFKSTKGKPIHLHIEATATRDGFSVSSKIGLRYSGHWIHSFFFMGLYPWVLFSLLYAFYSLDNKLLLGPMFLFTISFGAYFHLYKVTRETIICIRDVGIQTTRTYFTGRKVSHFYCCSSISDVVIEQGFQNHQIVSYISVHIILPEDRLKVVPLVCPKMEDDGLKLIYNNIYSLFIIFIYCASMNEAFLPDEIWLMMLRYVPLSDRLFSMQLVSKKFHSLCWDGILCRQADFSSEIFLSMEDCLKVIKRIKKTLKVLSLRNCHWISGSIFRHIPRSSVLQCLDLTGFPLTWQQLCTLSSKCPLLQKLAVNIDNKMLNTFSDEEKPRKLSLSLMFIVIAADTLHLVNLLDGVLAKLGTWVKNPLHVSFELFGNNMQGLRFVLPSTLNAGCSKNLTIALQMLNNSHLLCLSQKFDVSDVNQGMNNNNTDLADVRFFKLYMGCSAQNSLQYDSSSLVIPVIFPKLQCLILNLHSEFCTKTSHEHNWACTKCPQLRCLNISCGQYTCSHQKDCLLTEALFSFISSHTKLEELNLRCIQLNQHMVTGIFSSHRHLRSLSLPLSAILDTSENASSSSDHLPYPPKKKQRISRFSNQANTPNNRSVLSKLSTLFMTIKKLEISDVHENCKKVVPSYVLEPISQIKNLEDLCLSHIMVQDFTFLRMIFMKCCALKCLTLSDLGNPSCCMYLNVLANALPNLENIKVVRLKHASLDLSHTLFRGLGMCKGLEKLALSMDSVYYTSPAFLVNRIKSLAMNCPRLHLFALWSNDISPTLRNKIKRTIPEPSRQRSKLYIEFPEPGKMPPFAVYNLIDFERSIVATDYNAFNYPFSS